MTVDEVRAIREKKSLETIEMTAEELNVYFDKGANEIRDMINENQKKNMTSGDIALHAYKQSGMRNHDEC